jgi:hypothetical protein
VEPWAILVAVDGWHMVDRRRDAEALRAELAAVRALIAAHPLASQRTRAAHEVIENGASGDVDELDRELARRGLPGLGELGRSQVTGTWSWWKLHRRKRQLERRIQRLDER